MRNAILLLVVTLGSAGCDSCSGTPTAVPLDAKPEGSVARTPADAGDPLCAAILEEEKVDKSRLDCVAKSGWAWALRVDPADAGSIVQTLIVGGPDKKRARQTSTVDGVEWPPALGRHSAAFDFDGDGVPEFFALVPANVKTFAPAVRNLVTYKGGAIAPYPIDPTWLVEGVSDLDGDGRGDLRVAFDLGKRTICEPGDEGRIKLEFVAHGLPDGKFTLGDDAAATLAGKKCPAMPASADLFMPSIPQATDPRDLSLAWVSCSRLRGKSADAVAKELQTACAPNAAGAKTCKGPCRHLPDALVVAKFTPPVQAK